MVVIALGADGSVTTGDIGAALGVLCCTHLLVLVTNRELGGGSGSDAATEREEVASTRTGPSCWTGFATAPATATGFSPTVCI